MIQHVIYRSVSGGQFQPPRAARALCCMAVQGTLLLLLRTKRIKIIYWNLTLDPFVGKYLILFILNNSGVIVSDSKDTYFGP